MENGQRIRHKLVSQNQIQNGTESHRKYTTQNNVTQSDTI